MIEPLRAVLREIPYVQIGLVAGTVVLGVVLARVISALVGRQVEKRFDSTSALLARKIVFYGLLVFAFAVVLRELEVSLAALVAAGGLFGVALGFASQTAVSNVISGVFLIFERPFNVADAIKVEGNMGVVESIDLLSTKIRTFDNQYWRMPNEKLLKSDIITITRFDIRRMDIATSISYTDDIQRAQDVMMECAEDNHLVMASPEPTTLVNRMGDSGIELTLRCWFFRKDFIQLQSDLTRQVKVALEEAGMTIPFPHRTVYVRNEDDWQKAHLMEAEASERASDTDDS